MPAEQPENRCIYTVKVLFGLLWVQGFKKKPLKNLAPPDAKHPAQALFQPAESQNFFNMSLIKKKFCGMKCFPVKHFMQHIF